MITFPDAYQKVMDNFQNYGEEKVALKDAIGRVLAEDIFADRNFPPFNRATKDGIAINFEVFNQGQKVFKIQDVLAAGMPPIPLKDTTNCIEIMTGAMVPFNIDTVIMYEDLEIDNGLATIVKPPKKGQDIHIEGSDQKKGDLILPKSIKISAAEIGILATVGRSEVLVKKLPKTTIISTGNELVDVIETPLPHQIRKSNIYTLDAALSQEGIRPRHMHLLDDRGVIKKELKQALLLNDVLLLSGGVSMGKYDYIPEVLEELGVQKIFHKVLQRPGKPFWFGRQKETKTLIFSFPGNPASTFANYQVYFQDWLQKSLGLPVSKFNVFLNDAFAAKGDLTLLIRVKLSFDKGNMLASLVKENGSGDLTSLSLTDGFVILSPRESGYNKGDLVPFVPTRNII
ncbi:molybdopterin molybdotransferase [Arenibacter nanhaiticus]|uniref:Molybdopterin molybdenumtransferase n=1 Tax=Arenibacter nanhaiticus TaxID=558155 RepID=A0A1M6FS77_9FLAO|nr:molybdopterin molybdotransferase MoeA [Arenibacter nanhaiticus]SHJ00534.1 molybdopterin molybdotransferase [Arenibacter nanhaiticus]